MCSLIVPGQEERLVHCILKQQWWLLYVCSSYGWCVNCPSNLFTFSHITSSALWFLQPVIQF